MAAPGQMGCYWLVMGALVFLNGSAKLNPGRETLEYLQTLSLSHDTPTSLSLHIASHLGDGGWLLLIGTSGEGQPEGSYAIYVTHQLRSGSTSDSPPEQGHSRLAAARSKMSQILQAFTRYCRPR